jgi:hypothetical protein
MLLMALFNEFWNINCLLKKGLEGVSNFVFNDICLLMILVFMSKIDGSNF